MVKSLFPLLMLPLLCSLLQKPAAPVSAPPEETPRKTSMAARQNPVIRAFFRERFDHIPNSEVAYTRRAEHEDFLDKAIDNLIDMGTDKVWKLTEELHATRDRLWSSMTPIMLKELRALNDAPSGNLARRQAGSRLQQLKADLKKMERLAGEIRSQMEYIRYALDVSLDYRLEKADAPAGEMVVRDVELLARSVPVLEDALYEFFFPMKGSVSVDALTQESIPYLLDKIRKLAGRASDSLQER
jgi:hypothetical protein